MHIFYRNLLAGSFTVLALLVTYGASAQTAAPHQARLEYEAEPGCPNAEEFQDLVLARLGRVPFRSDAEWAIEVRLQGEGRAFRAHVAATTERTFESDNCSDLAAAAAVIVALALEAGPVSPSPSSSEPEPTTQPPNWRNELSPEARTALESLIQEEPPLDVEPEEEPVDPWELALRAELVASLGVVPGGGGGGLLGLDLAQGWLRLAIELHAEASVLSHGDKEVRGILVTGSFAPCFVFAPVFGCVVGSVGAMSSRAAQVVNPQWETRFFGSGGLRFGLEHSLGAFRVHASVEAVFPFTRQELLVGDQVVWEPSPVGGRIHLGGSWLLP